MRQGLGNSRTTWNIPPSESGVPEGEGEEQEIENLLEQIMKESFPNPAKEIHFQEVQEPQSPKEAGLKEEHTRAHHNYITQDVRWENLKKQEKRRELPTKEFPSADFSNLAGKKYLKSWKAKAYIQDYCMQQSYHLESKGR